MHSPFDPVAPRTPMRALRVTFLLVALAASILVGGPAWLLMVPAMFMLGRAYGSQADTRRRSDDAAYGVGAALAGFRPGERG